MLNVWDRAGNLSDPVIRIAVCRSALAAALAIVAGTLAAAEPQAIDFRRQIAPLLSDKCFRCHGPDAQQRKAGLRLDERDAATAAAESGEVAIVAGKPEASELLRRIDSDDPDERMPPPSSKKALSDDERALLRRWVQEGAPYDTLWSFVAPRRAPLPDVRQADWVVNPIDRFVLRRLEQAGLQPTDEASRESLIRRLSFDLTGLPPTLEQIEAFVADADPGAYERVVDRLLASPHFGERMAVQWLDAARFADTNGYHLDNGRDMSRWRAWVIDAFNRNLPFDQFTIEQLAGDLLPQATLQQQVASGFNRNHMINFEGGAIPQEYHTAYVVDRVNTTATVWLGLTVACAQCHDHKYDPVSQEEYYKLYAFFNNVPESGLDGNKGNAAPMIGVPTAEQALQVDALDQQLAHIRSRLTADWDQLDREQRSWEALAVADDGDSEQAAEEPLVLGPWHAVGPMLHPEGGRRAYNRNLGPENRPVQLDAKYFLDGKNYAWREEPDWIDGSEIRLDGQQSASFVFRTIETPVARKWSVSLGRSGALKVYLNGKQILADDKNRSLEPDQHHLTLDLQKGRNELLLKVVNFFEDAGFHFAYDGGKGVGLPENVAEMLETPPAERSADQRAALRAYFRFNVCDHESWKAVRAKLGEIRGQREALEARFPTTMVMSEMEAPRETHVLIRGQYDKQGRKVTAGVPSSLPPLPDKGPVDRLQLARWLVDPQQPLTSRVIVNRYWQMLFGTGLVTTAEDFGSRGALPSHPELLDWLAVEFQESSQPALRDLPEGRWNVKALLKLIVLSATYRQASRVSADRLHKDPDNRLLSRGARFRLPAEMIRDQALAVSGLLKHRIGGPSVSPYQPPGLWRELSSRGDSQKWTAQVFVQSKGDDLYRRSLYTFWKRTSPPPQMVALDAPDRETCTVTRARTNTPLQALILMNDPTYVEASRNLAQRVLRGSSSSDAARLAELFRRVTSRAPSEAEQQILTEMLQEQRSLFADQPDEAAALLKVGESPCDTVLESRELAAWTMVGNAVLNLDEVLTRG